MNSDQSVYFEILFVGVLIFLNGWFSLSEMALVSSRKARLDSLASKGDRAAQRTLKLMAEPDRFLSTVQIGITLVGIFSGAYGGARIAERLETWFEGLPAIAPYAAPLSIGLVVLVITYLSLIVGELLPKRIAIQSPEKIAMVVSGPMMALARIVHPVVSLLTWSTRTCLKHLGIRHDGRGPSVTEDEIKSMVEQGTQAGMFNKTEQAMVERVLDFSTRKVIYLMTPRPDIVWLDLENPLEKNLEKMAGASFSHFPVAMGSLDNIVGTVHVKAFLANRLCGDDCNLRGLAQTPLYIPEATEASRVLELFKETRTHIGFVIDEYGMVQGLVTLTDILEAVVGDIPARGIIEDEPIVPREDGSWLVDGLLTIEDFEESFGLDLVKERKNTHFHTVAGLIIHRLGRIPKTADTISLGNLRIEVIDMDANRVDKVLVSKLHPQGAPVNFEERA